MEILYTIIPIFAVILIGWIAQKKGFFSQDFLVRANHLVFYLAIPALVFRSVTKIPVRSHFNMNVIVIVIVSFLTIVLIAWGFARLLSIKRAYQATFIQSSFHGNLGYIGFAVAFYYLGAEGLSRTTIVAGFVMILQNTVAIILLQTYSADSNIKQTNRFDLVKKIGGNPVILAVIIGVLYSLTGVSLPVVISRSMDIIASLALPMALLIIGASLSFKVFQTHRNFILISSFLKLFLMPALGFTLFRYWDFSAEECLPGLIVLASPTATVVYVLAKEFKGDPGLAVAAISTSTLISAFSMSLWLISY